MATRDLAEASGVAEITIKLIERRRGYPTAWLAAPSMLVNSTTLLARQPNDGCYSRRAHTHAGD